MQWITPRSWLTLAFLRTKKALYAYDKLVDKIAPARRFFMRQAGGETGDLPGLLKGEALSL